MTRSTLFDSNPAFRPPSVLAGRGRFCQDFEFMRADACGFSHYLHRAATTEMT